MGHDRPGDHENWHPWPEEDDMGWRMADFPHPMPTDLEFTDSGDMIIGIRDRYMDTGPSTTEVFRRTAGDILHLKKTGDLKWTYTYDEKAPEHYTGDNLRDIWDEPKSTWDMHTAHLASGASCPRHSPIPAVADISHWPSAV